MASRGSTGHGYYVKTLNEAVQKIAYVGLDLERFQFRDEH